MLLNKWKRFKNDGSAFRRKVFTKLLLSFLLIFFLPLSIGVIMYGKMEDALIENANQSNLAMLEQIQMSVDSQMKEVEQLTLQIGLNPKTQTLLYNQELEYRIDPYMYVEFLKELNRYRNMSKFVDEYYVYFSDNDVIVSESMRTTTDMFYNHIQAYSQLTEEDFLRMLRGYNLKTYLPSQSVMIGGKMKEVITYIQSLPLGEVNEVKGSLVMVIDQEKITKLLDNIHANSGSFYMIDGQGQLVVNSGQVLDKSHTTLLEILRDRIPGKKGTLALQVDGHDMMVSYSNSLLNDWTYITVIPQEYVLVQVNEAKKLALQLVVVCLLAGTLIAYYLTYHNHRPIREVLVTILNGKRPASKEIKDELVFIKDAVESSRQEETQLRNQLRLQAPVIRSDFLQRLLRGSVDTGTLDRKDFEFLNLNFEHTYFIVVLIHIDDCETFIRDNTEREWALVRFIISNLSAEFRTGEVNAVELDRDQVALLWNIPENYPHHSEQVELELQQFRAILEERFRIRISIAVSNAHSGLAHIGECYGEATLAMEHRMIQGQNALIYYDSIVNARHRHYHYPTEAEVQLLNYARGGDLAGIQAVLEQIFEVNFTSRSISPEMGKFLVLEMSGTVLKVLGALRRPDLEMLEQEVMAFSAEKHTLEAIGQQLVEWYRTICEKVKEEKTDHSEQMLDTIKQYVDEHYQDNGLSLAGIADHCGLNPTYLSSFFKKHAGQTITEYITARRVNQAKRLLGESMSIAEIAKAVGYANDIGLIRVFKKLEGITPGKYRENL